MVSLRVLRLYRSSKHVQEDQKARRGAIRPETVLELMPQIWFLKATLVFPLGTTSHLNRYQPSSILDAAARVNFSIRHWTELTRTASAKCLLLCIPRSCLQIQPLWRIMTRGQMSCKDIGGHTFASGETTMYTFEKEISC